ncbi:uncharacterized protein phf11 [Leuresthes tenuis]|uniref:uncharacterized protein phf11 n=1 Tax=Leuresthes tenuis TaxID=355514 RepID=UPI003B50A033
MGNGRKTSCVLCHRSEETKITGALSTKEQVTAHQNCLLYSSGIFCTDSPLLDDLFGFSVYDVLDEVKRGSRLVCHHCKKKGATAGCELKRCKKSFHYPCAVQEGAEIFEDHENGKFGLYCLNHCEPKNGDSANELQKPRPAKTPSKAGPSKETYCLSCEEAEGNIGLESLSNCIIMSYCDKRAPSSHKRRSNGDSSAAGPSSHSSDSSSATRCSFKRQLSLGDPEEKVSPSKRKWKRITSDSSISDNELIPPLESDIDESANSVPEHQPTGPQLISTDSERPTGSPAGNQVADEVRHENNDEDETFIVSDAESESLLPPVKDYVISGASAALSQLVSVKVQTVKRECEESFPAESPVRSPEQAVARQSSPVPPPSPGRSKPRRVAGSPPCSSSVISPAAPEPVCVTLLSSPSPPPAPPSHSQPGIDSASFWRSCNAAGCTQAIFTDFINGMNDICSRIQAGQASQEDYSCALSVMVASGRLVEFVAKQQEEIQRKQTELQKAAAAMKEVVSALKK